MPLGNHYAAAAYFPRKYGSVVSGERQHFLVNKAAFRKINDAAHNTKFVSIAGEAKRAIYGLYGLTLTTNTDNSSNLQDAQVVCLMQVESWKPTPDYCTIVESLSERRLP